MFGIMGINLEDISIIIDILSNTYGAHAFACVLITYLKILWENRLNHHKDAEDKSDILNLSIEKFIFN